VSAMFVKPYRPPLVFLATFAWSSSLSSTAAFLLELFGLVLHVLLKSGGLAARSYLRGVAFTPEFESLTSIHNVVRRKPLNFCACE
jgi:hypothetical protein